MFKLFVCLFLFDHLTTVIAPRCIKLPGRVLNSSGKQCSPAADAAHTNTHPSSKLNMQSVFSCQVAVALELQGECLMFLSLFLS